MGTPQIIYLAINGVVIALTMFLHGKPKSPTTFNAYESALSFCALTALLYWGGFFSK